MNIQNLKLLSTWFKNLNIFKMKNMKQIIPVYLSPNLHSQPCKEIIISKKWAYLYKVYFKKEYTRIPLHRSFLHQTVYIKAIFFLQKR
ncbi:hypothetical protein BB020_05070 [Elizabethkingia occulta]|nr:hypothetical protein BB020_05070 [Elizabethkingia occulta]